MGLGVSELLVLGASSLLYVVPVVYFLVIVTRLSNAVERIANRLECNERSLKEIKGGE